MPFVKNDVYVDGLAKIGEQTLNPGGCDSIALITITTPEKSELNLALEMGSAKRLRDAILLAMRRNYVAAASKMLAEWAASRPWVRSVEAWGYSDSVFASIHSDPFPEEWTTTMQIARIHECINAGFSIGACLGTYVETFHHEQIDPVDEQRNASMTKEESKRREDEFFTVAYERKTL